MYMSMSIKNEEGFRSELQGKIVFMLYSDDIKDKDVDGLLKHFEQYSEGDAFVYECCFVFTHDDVDYTVEDCVETVKKISRAVMEDICQGRSWVVMIDKDKMSYVANCFIGVSMHKSIWDKVNAPDYEELGSAVQRARARYCK